MLTRVTDAIIEELLDAMCSDARSRHFFLHALHGLVRVAKAEQLQEMRLDLGLAVGRRELAAGDISLTSAFGSGSTEPT